ncbi:SDR family oxidoreductase [Pedobacter endophyticus]|uniref:SDR family NAD(P)-dependent oxidoreductase n=1 Tax=Pedobacter endophyticus TaxID=2789740 RepID=A0A7S9PZU9_9SPHI|nr:SDR family NAD(P)-dependent oxidoreductase [Pedobacter endophyticus]QPH40042.1 SDR family NAD(P)-dependent oxidoreductase [Pedobacter endophyticus]
MKTSNNTVLIVGGTAGIGLEIVKQLVALNNYVIVTGRDKQRLETALAGLQNVTPIAFDVSKESDVTALVKRIEVDFPQLNMVINNAGRAFVYHLADEAEDAFGNAAEEMMTNYLAIIRLNQKLMPILRAQNESAIVNVSSVVAFVPGINLPTYAASKAALHSYTTSLRLSLEETSVKVFELMPPLVDTAFSKEIGGHNGIKPAVVADEFIAALAKNEFEIRVGDTEKIYQLFRKAPAEALSLINGTRNVQ